MDEGLLLWIVAAALVVVVVAWVTREVVGIVQRRRGKPDLGATMADAAAGAAAELVPLLLQPITQFVKGIGKKSHSIDSLIGPDGDVSLLFSDIEGSTALNHKLGDEEFVRVIRAHDDIVERTVGRHGGTVVKTQGDGFMAAFRSPADAVGAAVALGPELDAADAIGVSLPVRIGVHTGRVVSTKNDLFGTNVAMAARVADAARGGEVLVTEAVRDELVDDDSLAFRERRHGLVSRGVRVKGLPGRHRFHVVTAGLVSDE